jgi:hypothetical protein
VIRPDAASGSFLLLFRVALGNLRRNLLLFILLADPIRVSLLLCVRVGDFTFSQLDHLLAEPPN